MIRRFGRLGVVYCWPVLVQLTPQNSKQQLLQPLSCWMQGVLLIMQAYT